MRSMLALLLGLAMVFGTAIGAPSTSPTSTSTSTTSTSTSSSTTSKPSKTSKTRSKRKPPSKPTPAPAPVPDPAPPQPAAPPPQAPAPPPPEPPQAPPEPTPLLAGAPPGSTPRLTMRPRAAHGGFVDDMDCSACHTTAGWQLAASAGSSGFDHDRTGFPLRAAHAQSPCGKCHTGKTKPANTCDGCHHDPHQGRNDGACAECHTTTAWSDTNTLEQHRRTRMPLTGRHATLDCSACHKRGGERVFSDVPTDCYACHRASYHDAKAHVHDGLTGAPPFSRACGGCHQTTAWSPAFADPTNLTRTALARTSEHDAYFVLTSGSHRTTECTACHTDAQRTKLVRCDGCHQDLALRRQHPTAIARSASACLRCHPRGAAR